MSFIKKNKKVIICITIGLILFLILVVFFIKALLPSGTNPWGNRLDGIEEHQIANEDIDKIKENIIATGIATEVKYINTGTLLNFIINVNDNVDRNKATSLTSYITSNISTDNQSFYDIQVYFTKTGEDAAFPFIGYKHKSSNVFSFSYAGG